jgi:hypothetical protein
MKIDSYCVNDWGKSIELLDFTSEFLSQFSIGVSQSSKYTRSTQTQGYHMYFLPCFLDNIVQVGSHIVLDLIDAELPEFLLINIVADVLTTVNRTSAVSEVHIEPTTVN